jgi:hypothetical protein
MNRRTLFIVGAVLVAGAVVWWLASRPRPTATGASAAAGAGGDEPSEAARVTRAVGTGVTAIAAAIAEAAS